MTMHFLEVVGTDGKRADYSGPLGSTNFEHGLSTEANDCDLWEVQRIIRPEDGGFGIGMTVAIVKDETTKEPGPVAAPQGSPPAPPPAAKQDRMAAARAAKAARRAGHDPGRGSGGH